jgi:hypothetical protein
MPQINNNFIKNLANYNYIKNYTNYLILKDIPALFESNSY